MRAAWPSHRWAGRAVRARAAITAYRLGARNHTNLRDTDSEVDEGLTGRRIVEVARALAASKHAPEESQLLHLESAALGRWSKLSCREVSVLAQCFAKLRCDSTELFDRIIAQPGSRLRRYPDVDVSLLAHSASNLRSAGAAPLLQTLEGTLGEQRLANMSVRCLSALAWSCAVSGVWDSKLMAGAYASVHAMGKKEAEVDARDLYQLYQADLSVSLEAGSKGDGAAVGLPDHLRAAARERMASDRHQSSGSEHQVARALSAMGMRFEMQATTSLGYSVDIQIGESAAIEYHGPHHYSRTLGTLGFYANPRPLGATLLKARHLRAAGWNIIEIPYWEWEQRRDLYARKRYLGRKLEPISDRLWGEHTVNN